MGHIPPSSYYSYQMGYLLPLEITNLQRDSKSILFL